MFRTNLPRSGVACIDLQATLSKTDMAVAVNRESYIMGEAVAHQSLPAKQALESQVCNRSAARKQPGAGRGGRALQGRSTGSSIPSRRDG